MSKSCPCNNPDDRGNSGCNCNHDRKDPLSWRNIAAGQDAINAIVPERPDKIHKKHTYRLSLWDGGTNDGYFLQFSREITIFEFASLLSEFFELNIDVGYHNQEDETLTRPDMSDEELWRFLGGLPGDFFKDEDDDD